MPQTGQELLTLKGHTDTGRRAWPSARTANAWPARVEIDRTTVKVWDAQTGQELLTLKGIGRSQQRGLQPGRQTPGQRQRPWRGTVGRVPVT